MTRISILGGGVQVSRIEEVRRRDDLRLAKYPTRTFMKASMLPVWLYLSR